MFQKVFVLLQQNIKLIVNYEERRTRKIRNGSENAR